MLTTDLSVFLRWVKQVHLSSVLTPFTGTVRLKSRTHSSFALDADAHLIEALALKSTLYSSPVHHVPRRTSSTHVRIEDGLLLQRLSSSGTVEVGSELTCIPIFRCLPSTTHMKNAQLTSKRDTKTSGRRSTTALRETGDSAASKSTANEKSDTCEHGLQRSRFNGST